MIKTILIVAGLWLLVSIIASLFWGMFFKQANGGYTEINPRYTHPQRSRSSRSVYGKAIERHREAMRRMQSKLN